MIYLDMFIPTILKERTTHKITYLYFRCSGTIPLNILMMIAPKSHVCQKEGGGRNSKKWRTDRDSEAKRGRSHRSNSVRGVGLEEQEKTWTVVWDTNPQEGLGTNPILS